MTRYRVEHETVYEYAEPVAVSHNELRLAPRALPHQVLRSLAMSIDPLPETVVPAFLRLLHDRPASGRYRLPELLTAEAAR